MDVGSNFTSWILQMFHCISCLARMLDLSSISLLAMKEIDVFPIQSSLEDIVFPFIVKVVDDLKDVLITKDGSHEKN